MRNIIKYIGIILVIAGIILVMKNLFSKDTDLSNNKKDKTETKEVYYNARIKLLDKDTDAYISGAKLVLKDEKGKVINSWSSTTKEYDMNKRSIFTITCVDGDEDTIQSPIEYDSYLHSCLQESRKSIYPSFSVNVVKNNNGEAEKIIVYYTLKQKAIDRSYIPSKITLSRVRELIERCNNFVAKYKEENNGEYPVDSFGKKITELGFLSEINGINPATGKPFDDDTREFYDLIFSTCFNLIDVNVLFQSMEEHLAADSAYCHTDNVMSSTFTVGSIR